MQHGATDKRCKKLIQELGISRDSIRKWRIWWQQKFCQSAYWKSIRGILSPIDSVTLPSTLIAIFEKKYPIPEAVIIKTTATIGLHLYPRDSTEIRSLIDGLITKRYFPQT
jgi:hypothetical protein